MLRNNKPGPLECSRYKFNITNKRTRFEKHLEKLDIKQKSIHPYSLWQNRIVERSQRIDNELFYIKR